MTFYVSRASYTDWRDDLKGVNIVIIGSDLKPELDNKKAQQFQKHNNNNNKGDKNGNRRNRQKT